MHCGLMCGIWDWQSTIVEDLNDSQDPKHTLFCRENAFVAIYALFSDNKCPLFTRLGGGSPKGDNVTFFYRFSYIRASLSFSFKYFIGKTAAVDSKSAVELQITILSYMSIHRSAKRIGLETCISLSRSPILFMKLTSNILDT